MSGDDPFNLGGDDVDKTIIRTLTPKNLDVTPVDRDMPTDETVVFGGAASDDRLRRMNEVRASLAAGAASSDRVEAGASKAVVDHPNPLISGGSFLLGLGSHLRRMAQPGEIKDISEKIVRELGVYERTARQRGANQKEIELGHYTLCALLDDVILSTPWGMDLWAQRSLCSAFHNQVDSGNRLFDLANRLQKEPDRYPNVLELIYVAASVGFEGRLRGEPQGRQKHKAFRQSLSEALRTMRPQPAAALSPHWQGADIGFVPLFERIRLWMWWSGFALVAAVLYLVFWGQARLVAQGSTGPLAAITWPEIAPPIERFVQSPIADDRLDVTRSILEQDISAGRVMIEDLPGKLKITLISRSGGELFRSASATLSADYRKTLARVAEAAAVWEGRVLVEGHSDSQGISSRLYASNVELSADRASTVAEMLKQYAPVLETNVLGRGAEHPIATNETADGRRQNRRVDVIIDKAAPR